MIPRICLVLSIIGIGILLFSMNLPAKQVRSIDDIKELPLNTKVILYGKVTEEKLYDEFKIMKINGIDATCSNCLGQYKGKEILIEGLVSEYEGTRQIKVLRLR